MSYVALSKLGYQKDKSDPESVVWFEEGDEVKGVDKEVVEQWKVNGTIGEPPPALAHVAAEKEQLEARVAQLEQQLEDAKKEQTGSSSSTAPSAPAKVTPTKSTP